MGIAYTQEQPITQQQKEQQQQQQQQQQQKQNGINNSNVWIQKYLILSRNFS